MASAEYHRQWARNRRARETPEEREHRLKKLRDSHHRHKSKRNAESRNYYRENVAATVARAIRWRQNNRVVYLSSQERSRRKRRKNPAYKLRDAVSSAIHHSLKSRKGGRKWQPLVGYSLAELTRHLERQFLPGMSWANYGLAWEVDHIIPLCQFVYETAEDSEFKAAWALANLRPLWKSDNRSKSGNRIYLI